jgi:hypothetical protein
MLLAELAEEAVSFHHAPSAGLLEALIAASDALYPKSSHGESHVCKGCCCDALLLLLLLMAVAAAEEEKAPGGLGAKLEDAKVAITGGAAGGAGQKL